MSFLGRLQMVTISIACEDSGIDYKKKNISLTPLKEVWPHIL